MISLTARSNQSKERSLGARDDRDQSTDFYRSDTSQVFPLSLGPVEQQQCAQYTETCVPPFVWVGLAPL